MIIALTKSTVYPQHPVFQGNGLSNHLASYGPAPETFISVFRYIIRDS